MAIQLVTQALAMNFRSSSLKFIFILLANHANQDSECWVSYKTLATETQLSRRFIISAIQIFEEEGLVIKQNRYHSNQRSRSNLYKILPNFIPKVINKGELTSLGRVNSLHQGRVNSLHPSKEKQKRRNKR